MNNKLVQILSCPKCKQKLERKKGILECKNDHQFKLHKGVPIFANLDPYLQTEAKAWEDEWREGISKPALSAYKKNMKVFKKLGFWEESAEAAGFIPTNPKMTVLDLGCGNGVSTAHIKGSLVVGMDLSENQMVRAKEKYKKANYVVGDARRLPFLDNTFDTVVAINLLHHIKDFDLVLKEVHRVLKTGGKFLSVDPNLYNPIGFVGRGLFRLLDLKRIFPNFPQFALGEDERQFSKKEYYTLFRKSKFNNFIITPHRIERGLFFFSILIPPLAKIPFYENFLILTSTIGNVVVKIPPFDNICYFWKGEAIKSA